LYNFVFIVTVSAAPHPQVRFTSLHCFYSLYYPLFVTVSHSAAFRRNLKTHCFQSVFTSP